MAEAVEWDGGNPGLEGNLRRAIDVHEGDKINAQALKALIKAAVKLNGADRDERKPHRPSSG